MVQMLPSRAKPGRREAVRAEILRRAADAFREKGFHGASMRDIAGAMDMTPGSLYYYFRSKDDLLHACQTLALDRLLAGAKAIVSGSGPAPGKLRALVRAHVRCLLEETGGSAAHLEFRALPGPRRTAIAARRDAYERLWRAVMAAGAAEGTLRAVDGKLATLALLGAANGTVVWWRPEGPRRPLEIADAYADILVGGLEA